MKALQVVIAILLAGVLGLQVYQFSHKPGAAGGEDPEKIKRYAIALQENAPDKALAEYERYAQAARLADEDAANLYLTMGNLALERLHDYATAFSYYQRVKSLYPKSAAAEKVGRKIVTCLENMGQSFDAQRQLASETALTATDKPTDKGDDVLAEVGDTRITRRMFEQAAGQLSPETRQKVMASQESKKDFLEGLVAKELFYRMAMRKGYDKDPEYLGWLDNVRKTRLGSRIWEEEVTSKVQVTDSDFYSFYQQHPELFKEPAQYTKVGLIICNNEPDARKARERVEKGEDFAAVAAEANRDEALRNAKGLLSPFYENREAFSFDRDLKLTPLLKDMKVGDMTGPIEIQAGSGVIKLIDKIDARIVPFDEAKQTRTDDYRQVLEFDRKQKLIQHLQETDKVKLHEDRL